MCFQGICGDKLSVSAALGRVRHLTRSRPLTGAATANPLSQTRSTHQLAIQPAEQTDVLSCPRRASHEVEAAAFHIPSSSIRISAQRYESILIKHQEHHGAYMSSYLCAVAHFWRLERKYFKINFKSFNTIIE